MAQIKLASGAVIETHTGPSKDLDLVTADVSVLKSLGFPLPPQNPEAFERWKAIVSRKLEYIEADISIVPNTYKTKRPLLVENDTSTNWSGCVMTAAGMGTPTNMCTFATGSDLVSGFSLAS